MASRYGHAWVSQYGPSPAGFAGAEWRETLSGIDEARIKSGFTADIVRGADWPPSSTAFRAMCFDIPSVGEVRKQLSEKNADRSPFVNLVWRNIDGHRYKMADADKADRILREAHAMAREHVMSGGALPDALRQLAVDVARVHQPAAEAITDKYMADLRRKLYGDEPAEPA